MSDVVCNLHLGEVKSGMESAVERFLTEAGLHLEGDAKYALEMDPKRIDTGLLRNSITWALDGEAPAIKTYKNDPVHATTPTTIKNGTAGKPTKPVSGEYSGTAPKEPSGRRTLYIGTNVEYGKYVHDGTMGMDPNRFLTNAIELNKDQLKQKMQEAMRNG